MVMYKYVFYNIQKLNCLFLKNELLDMLIHHYV